MHPIDIRGAYCFYWFLKDISLYLVQFKLLLPEDQFNRLMDNAEKKDSIEITAQKWVDEYGDYLFRFAMMRTNNQKLSEDLIQDTLLSAIKAYENFDQRSSQRTWLISILKNKIIDHYRKTSRRQEVDIDETFETDYREQGMMKGAWKIQAAPSDWGEHPEKDLERKEFMVVLRDCLQLLPERISIVFSMREIDGEASDIICKELDISPSNLWVMLHRARTQLRKCLEMNWFGSRERKGS